jgi:hypothetical protein
LLLGELPELPALEAEAPEFGWALVSGVDALFVLLQPMLINPNISRASMLCLIDENPSFGGNTHF